jgi:hypothetical protein
MTLIMNSESPTAYCFLPTALPQCLESHPESPPGDCVREFLKEEFSGLLN